MLLAVHTSLEDWLHFPHFKKFSQENILLLSYVLQWPNVSFCRNGFRLPHIPKHRCSMKHARSHPAVHECYWPEIYKGHRFAFKQINNCRNYIRYSILWDERPQMVRVDLIGVIQCAASSMALSFHLLGGRRENTEWGNRTKIQTQVFSMIILDNGFCPCSYNCSLILSYFHTFVICSECSCILFLGDKNTVNDDDDASGIISLGRWVRWASFSFLLCFPPLPVVG